jgi:hypothetical protein
MCEIRHLAPLIDTLLSFAGAYFCLNMILITLSTFLSVIVINLYFRGDKKSRVPKWLKRVSLPRSDSNGYLIYFAWFVVSHESIVLRSMSVFGKPLVSVSLVGNPFSFEIKYV